MPANAIEADVRHERIYLGHGQHEDRAVPVYRLPGKVGYFFQAAMAVDVDGSPNAYRSPKCTDNSTPLDDIGNATSNSLSYIQGFPSHGRTGRGPHPGYYVSQTSLGYPHDDDWDCGKWVDGETIPYIILPDHYLGASLGDAAYVVHIPTGRYTHALFADTNPLVGEASLKVARNLHRALTPSDGDDNDHYIYLFFPGVGVPSSSHAPHWPEAAIKQAADAAFATWGGWAQLRASYPQLPAQGTPPS